MRMRYRALSEERSPLYPAIGLRLIDDFTGGRPGEPVRVRLEEKADDGTWKPSSAEAVFTPEGVVSFHNLVPATEAGGAPKTFRAIVEPSRSYDPAYRRRVNGHDLDGLEFVVHPFGGGEPPTDSPRSAETDGDFQILYPSAAYAFPALVPVVRGTVRDLATGEVLVRAQVSNANKQSVLVSEKGFALPIRWPARPTRIAVDATAGDTTLVVEDVTSYGTVPRVELTVNSVTHVRDISNVDPNGANGPEFTIAPAASGVDPWVAGTEVRPLAFQIDVIHGTRSASHEVALPDGFADSHEILL